jgi:hypothetical protein
MAAVMHLATSLKLQGSINKANTRNSSGIQSGRGGGRQGSGHGRGRGQGRGCRRGRNIYLGSYSPDQWAALSPEDKQKVRDGRANSATSIAGTNNQNQQHQGRGTQGAPKRGIGAVTVDRQQQDDAILVITNATGLNQATTQRQGQTDPSTAGQSMSRRQHINALTTTS